MNRMFRISLLLVAGLAVGRLSYEGSANAQVAGGPPPCQDVNGDGQSNIADAVFLLNWLFSDGPRPECKALPRLPATGQTRCYDTGGNTIACDDATWPGQEGFYRPFRRSWNTL